MFHARAREPCISEAGDKGDVTINRAPLAIESVLYDAVNHHFWHATNQEPHNVATSLVNFVLAALAIGVILAGADDGLFMWRGHNWPLVADRDAKSVTP